LHQYRFTVRLCHAGRMPYTDIGPIERAQAHRQILPLATAPMVQSVRPGRMAHQPIAESTPPWRSLSDYFAQQHRMFEDTELVALLEPRRILAPPGYHPTRCVSAGMFTLLGNRILKAAAGRPQVPTEFAAHIVVYQVIRYRVPIYFIDQDVVRAVAATDLPHDFRLADLHWPMPSMVVGFPAQFMMEYLGRDVCYVYAANCDAGDYIAPGMPGCPTITVPRPKVAWQFYCWQTLTVGGRRSPPPKCTWEGAS